MDVYMGIDVAVATSKRLPICVLDTRGHIVPARWKKIERGPGNRALIANRNLAKEWADRVAEAIRVELEQGHLECQVIMVDAPSAPAQKGRRQCEEELKNAGVSFFQTPPLEEFESWYKLSPKDNTHIPNANRIWMLAGLELFKALKRTFPAAHVLETYPEAIAHAYGKSGNQEKLAILAAELPSTIGDLWPELRRAIWGSCKDVLDAALCALTAAMWAKGQVRCWGREPGEAIYVPVPTMTNFTHPRPLRRTRRRLGASNGAHAGHRQPAPSCQS